jgi:hypothetical protein
MWEGIALRAYQHPYITVSNANTDRSGSTIMVMVYAVTKFDWITPIASKPTRVSFAGAVYSR